ncbi:putative rRNA methylase, S-adenosyl-L-methionine-dependent methyltransferase [Helianthus annuus]|nr:putative rRNA methylase, S-adenosyl-L-methionine-dependent methyltransferase [Helianthus annuus]
MMDYLFGKRKATEVAHSPERDAVVDATCGNGYDTLAMANMVADESCSGHVYSLDIQETALQNTASLLDKSLDPHKRETVELFATCHSKMEEVVPRGVTVRLVAFNLGYLPGGDKTVITKSETTLLGMNAASRILASGGLISVLVYVGHPGGMEEYEMVEGFASGLAVNDGYAASSK